MIKTIEIFGTVTTVLAVAGVILNNRKMIACFYLWMASNVISAYIHYDAELYSLLIRDIIFLVLAFEGVVKWKTPKKQKQIKARK